MSRSLYWPMAFVMVVFMIALPLLLWLTGDLNPSTVAIIVGLDGLCLLALVGYYDHIRFQNWLRTAALIIALIFGGLIGNQLATARASGESINFVYIGNVLIFGIVPFLGFAVRGSRIMTLKRNIILIATSNPHKIEEIQAVLDPLGVTTMGLHELDQATEEPVEDADTFAGNARLKAVGYAQQTLMMCLADDSGLVVDALDGAPGVHSARYAGIGETRDERDQANNAKLLDALQGVPDDKRTARFMCAMCLAGADGSVLAESTGAFEGAIGHAPRGTNGFGYDPLLDLPGEGKTAAELTADEKNARSHRGQATRAMAGEFRKLF
ncbi:MAG: RdgB/HAM1 family non-canonical purine NTP pyrophosphatase [Planctomycetota bacterium]